MKTSSLSGYSQDIQDQITVKTGAIALPRKKRRREKHSPRLNGLFWFRFLCIALVVMVEVGGIAIWAASVYPQIEASLEKPTPVEYNCVHVRYAYDKAHQLVISTDYTCSGRP